MLGHPVWIDAEACPSLGFRFEMGPDMHAAWIEPDEERLLVPMRTINEINRSFEEFLVDRLHPLLGQRARVFAFLLAPGAEAWIITDRIGRCGKTFKDPARPE